MNIQKSELDAVVEAGRILVTSGAEVYRVEETMKHMAEVFGIINFESYVVNGAVIVSGCTRRGKAEARVANVIAISVNLGKLEAVNALSRSLKVGIRVNPQYVQMRLKMIEEMKGYSYIWVLIAYFIGALGFSLALGSSWMDSIVSGVAGMSLGLVMVPMQKFVKAQFLQTIVGSAVVTFVACVLHWMGLGEHIGLMILGALMVMVPGAAFVNSVREFSQNNYSTGLTLLMSALLTGISISVGVAMVIALLPFANQMSEVFSGDIQGISGWVVRVVSAGVGTVAFALLYGTPKRYFWDLFWVSAMSWLLYLVFNLYLKQEVLSTLLPGIIVVLCSRALSVRRRCPMTIFLATSIFPLVPGLSFYRAVYFLIVGHEMLALQYMHSCATSAFTIIMAISVVQQMPIKWFQFMKKGKK